MIFVIDGFNLIYKFIELENFMNDNQLELAMNGLIEKLIKLKKIKKNYEFHIFFDGKKRKGDDTYQEEIQGIHCYYSHDIKADNLIENFIQTKKAKNFTNICVVSSDKKIINATKSLRYEHKSSEEFYEIYNQIVNPKKEKKEKPDSITKEELKDWLQLFKNRK